MPDSFASEGWAKVIYALTELHTRIAQVEGSKDDTRRSCSLPGAAEKRGRMPRQFRSAILCSVMLLTGCYGQAELQTMHAGGPGSGGPGNVDATGKYVCDTSQFSTVAIQDIAND